VLTTDCDQIGHAKFLNSSLTILQMKYLRRAGGDHVVDCVRIEAGLRIEIADLVEQIARGSDRGVAPERHPFDEGEQFARNGLCALIKPGRRA